MTRSLFSTVLALALAVPAAIACDGPPVCTVVDPTGTPLNVRSGPNGVILASLERGEKVEIVEHKEAGGQRWALVANYTNAWGYVFGDYLICDGADEIGPICTVADPTGTPLNVREEPNGAILGTWENGVRVRPYEEVKAANGKTWYAVERFADDNAIGWVFDPYLSCEEDSH